MMDVRNIKPGCICRTVVSASFHLANSSLFINVPYNSTLIFIKIDVLSLETKSPRGNEKRIIYSDFLFGVTLLRYVHNVSYTDSKLKDSPIQTELDLDYGDAVYCIPSMVFVED
jgi:hypothetical protein